MQLGPRREFNSSQFNKSVQGVASLLATLTADSVTFFISDLEIEDRDTSWIARRVVETICFNLYKFEQLKKPSKKRSKKWRVQIAVESTHDLKLIRQGIRIGKAISEGVNFARDLGNPAR